MFWDFGLNLVVVFERLCSGKWLWVWKCLDVESVCTEDERQSVAAFSMRSYNSSS